VSYTFVSLANNVCGWSFVAAAQQDPDEYTVGYSVWRTVFLFVRSYYLRSIMVGDWNTLPEEGRGARDQIRLAYQQGMVDISTYRPEGPFACCDFLSMLSLFTVFSVVTVGSDTVVLMPCVFMVTLYVWFSPPFERDRWVPTSVPTFWGYPNEAKKSIHGLQRGCQLDRVAVNSGGILVKDFEAVGGMDIPKMTARECFAEGGNVDLEGCVPASDHLPVVAVLDVGTSRFGRILKWLSGL
jgi:hypothetical protein